MALTSSRGKDFFRDLWRSKDPLVWTTTWTKFVQLLTDGDLQQSDYDWTVILCPKQFAEKELERQPNRKPWSKVLYAVLLHHHVSRRKDKKARELRREMRRLGVGMDASMYQAIIRAYLSNGNVRGADVAFEEMKSENLKPTLLTYEEMIFHMSKRNEWKRMRDIEVEASTQDMKLSNMTLKRLISCYGQAGMVSDTIRLFKKLSVHTNLEYRQIMSMTRAFCRKQRFQDAENFLMEMETLGKPMNIAPYNMLLAAHMRAGHAHSANAFFTRMRDRPNGPKPDQITYGILIRVHGKTKQMYRVDDLFNEMRDEGLVPDTSTYNAMIENWGRNERIDRAEEIFEDMVREGVKADMRTFNNLMHGYAVNNKMHKARKLFKQVESVGLEPNAGTYCNYIDGLVLYDQFSPAFNLWQKMKKKGLAPTDLGYCAMIRLYIKRGSLSKAKSMWKEMKETVGPNKSAYYSLICAFGDSYSYGNLEAIQLFQSARDKDKIQPFASFLNESTSSCHVAVVQEMPSTVACVAIRWALFNLEPDRHFRIVTSREHRLALQAEGGGSIVKQDVLKMVRKMKLKVVIDQEADARLHIDRAIWSNWKQSFE